MHIKKCILTHLALVWQIIWKNRLFRQDALHASCNAEKHFLRNNYFSLYIHKQGRFSGHDRVFKGKRQHAVILRALTCFKNGSTFKETFTDKTVQAIIISLLPKPGKDHLGTFFFFAKILEKHIYKCCIHLIHLDQIGSINSIIWGGLWGLCDLTSVASSLQHPVVAVSLDSEKAFDWIEWPHLFYASGLRCLQWITALYHEPDSSAKCIGLISAPFQLDCSARRGCALSPLLLIVDLEPLARTTWRDRGSTGVSTVIMISN